MRWTALVDMRGYRTVFVVDWWAPGGRYPDGDITVEEISTDDPNPKNWSRGSHYIDYFPDAETAYRYAENIQAELGIKAVFGSYESYQRGKEVERSYLMEVEEVETRQRNSMYGWLSPAG
jgi:hypothetical protein